LLDALEVLAADLLDERDVVRDVVLEDRGPVRRSTDDVDAERGLVLLADLPKVVIVDRSPVPLEQIDEDFVGLLALDDDVRLVELVEEQVDLELARLLRLGRVGPAELATEALRHRRELWIAGDLAQHDRVRSVEETPQV